MEFVNVIAKQYGTNLTKIVFHVLHQCLKMGMNANHVNLDVLCAFLRDFALFAKRIISCKGKIAFLKGNFP